MESERINKLEARLLEFAGDVAMVVEQLPENRFGTYMLDQITRSGISPALNYGEAQGAESRKDFIHKMKICLKELKETHNSLRIVHRYLQKKGQPNEEVFRLAEESQQLVYIFYRSLKTAKENLIKGQD